MTHLAGTILRQKLHSSVVKSLYLVMMMLWKGGKRMHQDFLDWQ
jgi:hypothetical protein